MSIRWLHSHISRRYAPVLLCILLVACNKSAPTNAEKGAQPTPAPVATTSEPTPAKQAFDDLEVMSFEEFERRVAKVPDSTENYIVNGDIRIVGRRNLEAYFNQMKRAMQGISGGKLLVNRLGLGQGFAGRADIWDSERRKNLTYCVSKEFEEHEHSALVAALAEASAEWERYADVDFIYRADADADCNPEAPGILFAVVFRELGSGVYAQAPFPSFQQRDRRLEVNDEAFSIGPRQRFDLTGLMRHELGHVLGFDHEQSRPEAGACFEPNDSFGATSYDPRSVMHYPACSGASAFSGFMLSDLDKSGVACVYGKGPATNSDNVCNYEAAYSAATGREVTERLSSQQVTAAQWERYGPYQVKPNSIATIALQRDGSAGGDPDLYIRYVRPPSLQESESFCKPRLNADLEQCRVQIPNNRHTLYVGVYGVEASKYTLTVTYTKEGGT